MILTIGLEYINYILWNSPLSQGCPLINIHTVNEY